MTRGARSSARAQRLPAEFNSSLTGFLVGVFRPRTRSGQFAINTNLFTTEYSRAGFGRIDHHEARSGKMRGNFNFNLRNDSLNDTQFNARSSCRIHGRIFRAMSGPLMHDKLTMTLSAQRNDSFNDTVVNDRPFGMACNSATGPGLFDTSINISKAISLVKGERAGQGEGFPGRGPGRRTGRCRIRWQ